MVVDVGEDQLVHAGTSEIPEVGRVSGARAAIAEHRHGGKPLDQR